VVVAVEVIVDLEGPEPGSGGHVERTGPDGSDVVVAAVAGHCLGTSLRGPSLIVDHNIPGFGLRGPISTRAHMSYHVLTYPALTEWPLRSVAIFVLATSSPSAQK
jgi:hypothetical protein